MYKNKNKNNNNTKVLRLVVCYPINECNCWQFLHMTGKKKYLMCPPLMSSIKVSSHFNCKKIERKLSRSGELSSVGVVAGRLR